MDKTIETLKALRDQMLAYTTEGDAVFYSEESAGNYAEALDALLSRVGELEAENGRLQEQVRLAGDAAEVYINAQCLDCIRARAILTRIDDMGSKDDLSDAILDDIERFLAEGDKENE
jgi:hypothetical protein